MPLETQKPSVDIASGQAAVTVADGADVTQGAQADAAITTDTGGSQAGKLRGIVKMLASAWDSVNNRFRVGVHDDGNSISVDDGGGVLSTDSTDGAHATLGATSDADTANTVIGRLKKIVALLGGGLPAALTGSGNLKVAIVEGGGSGGGVSQADKSGFTEGTSAFTPVGGVFNETPASDPTEDQAAAVRITQKRAAHVNLRDAAGNEVGGTAKPVVVEGKKANNGGAPGATNSGTLPAVATADEPSYTEGNQVSLSLDLLGRLRTRWHAKTSGSKHYVFEHWAAGAAVGTNLLGLRKTAANPVVRIYRIDVLVSKIAAGLGVPVSLWRATSVAGGTLVTAANVPKKDTQAGNATLEVRTGPGVTGTKAARWMFSLGGSTATAASLTGPLYTWRADREEEEIVLRGDEGLIFDMALGGDGDDRMVIAVHWRED